MRLGELLVDRGFVTPHAVSARARRAARASSSSTSPARRSTWARAGCPATLARRYGAIPVRFLDDGAAARRRQRPDERRGRDDLRLALGAHDPGRRRLRATRSPHAITALYAGELDFDDDDGPDDGGARREPSSTCARPPRARPRSSRSTQLLRRALDARRLRHPLRAAAQAPARPRPRRRRLRELATIPKALQPAVTSRLKVMARAGHRREAPAAGRPASRSACGGRSIDLRVAVLPTTHGEKVTLRITSSSEAPLSLAELGMSDAAAEALRRTRSAQPFGADHRRRPDRLRQVLARSTPALEPLNDAERSITTIEDPVE